MARSLRIATGLTVQARVVGIDISLDFGEPLVVHRSTIGHLLIIPDLR
jgi:hypothetical protein